MPKKALWKTLGVAVVSAAAFVLSANVASMTGEHQPVSASKGDPGSVVDKPGDQARKIELLERIHRGW